MGLTVDVILTVRNAHYKIKIITKKKKKMWINSFILKISFNLMSHSCFLSIQYL